MQNRDLLRASLRLVGYLVLDTVVGAIIGVLLLTVLDVYLGVPVEILLEYEDAARVALAGAIGGFAAAFACQIRFAVGETLGCRTLGLNTVIGAAAGPMPYVIGLWIDPVSREALLGASLGELGFQFMLFLGVLPLSIIGAIASFVVTLIHMMRARRGVEPSS